MKKYVCKSLSFLLTMSFLLNSFSALCMRVGLKKGYHEIPSSDDSFDPKSAYGAFVDVPEDVIKYKILPFAGMKAAKNIRLVNSTFNEMFNGFCKSFLIKTDFKKLRDDLIYKVEEHGFSQETKLEKLIKYCVKELEGKELIHLKGGKRTVQLNKRNFRYWIYKQFRKSIEKYRKRIEDGINRDDPEDSSYKMSSFCFVKPHEMFCLRSHNKDVDERLNSFVLQSYSNSQLKLNRFLLKFLIRYAPVLGCSSFYFLLCSTPVAFFIMLLYVLCDLMGVLIFGPIFLPVLPILGLILIIIYFCINFTIRLSIHDKEVSFMKLTDYVLSNLEKIVFGVKPTEEMKKILEDLEKLDRGQKVEKYKLLQELQEEIERQKAIESEQEGELPFEIVIDQ